MISRTEVYFEDLLKHKPCWLESQGLFLSAEEARGWKSIKLWQAPQQSETQQPRLVISLLINQLASHREKIV